MSTVTGRRTAMLAPPRGFNRLENETNDGAAVVDPQGDNLWPWGCRAANDAIPELFVKRSLIMAMDCSKYPLNPPKIVAIAKDPKVVPTNPFPDRNYLPGVDIRYDQDLTFGTGRVPPNREHVRDTEVELKPLMRKLVDIFAKSDKWGMAEALVDKFLKKQNTVTFFEWHALNVEASRHPHIRSFCSKALSAPNSEEKAPPGKIRIHQALENANWDINKIVAPTDLREPAFNLGSKLRATEDFANGLGLMIDGVQYVFVVVENYHYDDNDRSYCIKLKYYFYDVFGLDDKDLADHGYRPGMEAPGFSHQSAIPQPLLEAMQGITAWWQLQHQFNYAPLVTRIRLEQNLEVPTALGPPIVEKVRDEYKITQYDDSQVIKIPGDALFAFDKAAVNTPDAQAALRNAINYINDAQKKAAWSNTPAFTRMSIEGHTDNIGGFEYNTDLSNRRAMAVLNFFKNNKSLFDHTYQFESKGYGYTKPVESNRTPEGRAKNRRVEIHLFKK